MIRNRYGKVVVIILIIIVAICFVYNEVNLVHSISYEENTVKEGEDELNHRKVESKSDGNSENKNNNVPVKKESKEHTDHSNTAPVSAMKSIKTKDGVVGSDSMHDTVMLMKNLLSIQVKHRRTPKITLNSPAIDQDGELEKKLMDSDEIDLSPPRPLLISPHTKLLDLEEVEEEAVREEDDKEVHTDDEDVLQQQNLFFEEEVLTQQNLFSVATRPEEVLQQQNLFSVTTNNEEVLQQQNLFSVRTHPEEVPQQQNLFSVTLHPEEVLQQQNLFSGTTHPEQVLQQQNLFPAQPSISIQQDEEGQHHSAERRPGSSQEGRILQVEGSLTRSKTKNLSNLVFYQL